MSITSFSESEILAMVPHRFENILVDHTEMEVSENCHIGRLSLTIGSPDRLGRQIFTKQKQAGHYVLLSTVFMEVLAIGSIVCSNRAQPGQLVFFAGISHFKKSGDFPVGTTVTGKVVKKKDKGGFLLCHGELQLPSGDAIGEGDMLAYFAQDTVEQTAGPKKQINIDLSHHCSVPLVRDLNVKELYAIDELVQLNLTHTKTPGQLLQDDRDPQVQAEPGYLKEDRKSDRYAEGIEGEDVSIVGKYTYPTTHPLIKGHFPDRPVMMGVMQWMMVEDAVLGLAQHLYATVGKTGSYIVSGHADLVKPDKTSVCEIRGFEVQVHMKDAPYFDQADCIKTEKLSFRDTVSPGDTVYIRLHSLRFTPA